MRFYPNHYFEEFPGPNVLIFEPTSPSWVLDTFFYNPATMSQAYQQCIEKTQEALASST
jgi:hypothetical protein